MRNPARTPFGAIFRNELLLNSKRVVPYAMALLFGGNALLWWGWGPAESRGLAVNGDHFIAAMLPVFSFMTLPLFTAVIMGDPVIRDLRAGVTPLVFSTPVGRASYLLGKFSGNFFVLVCCQAAFPLTFFALQWFRRPNMIVQPVKAFPYLKHFVILVVVSHLALAALHFTVGTLTRNPKIVYALAVLLYPLYALYQTSVLRGLSPGWRTGLDPLLMNFQQETTRGRDGQWVSGELLNRLAVVYGPEAVANRAGAVLFAAACLSILYVRFAQAERAGGVSGGAGQLSTLDLSAQSDRLYNDAESLAPPSAARPAPPAPRDKVAIPKVNVAGGGFRAGLTKLLAALGVEFRLLRAERGLVVFVPLAVFLSTLEPAFYGVTPGVPYSAAYAGDAAGSLLLLLLGLVVFYTGEGVHRDRELRVEPVLWAAPAPDPALLLSKFFATLLLALALVTLVSLASLALQVYRGHAPVELSPYFTAGLLILAPTAALAAAASVLLNVLLRDKYAAYAAEIAAGTGLFYLYGQGHNHPLYNPALYRLWTHADLDLAGAARLLPHRLYCLALACLCLALAHFCYGRKTDRKLARAGRLTGAGWSLLLTFLSLAAATISALLVLSQTR